jgi:hypothetical protein
MHLTAHHRVMASPEEPYFVLTAHRVMASPEEPYFVLTAQHVTASPEDRYFDGQYYTDPPDSDSGRKSSWTTPGRQRHPMEESSRIVHDTT